MSKKIKLYWAHNTYFRCVCGYCGKLIGMKYGFLGYCEEHVCEQCWDNRGEDSFKII